MGFFQSLKDDLSSSMNEIMENEGMTSADGIDLGEDFISSMNEGLTENDNVYVPDEKEESIRDALDVLKNGNNMFADEAPIESGDDTNELEANQLEFDLDGLISSLSETEALAEEQSSEDAFEAEADNEANAESEENMDDFADKILQATMSELSGEPQEEATELLPEAPEDYPEEDVVDEDADVIEEYDEVEELADEPEEAIALEEPAKESDEEILSMLVKEYKDKIAKAEDAELEARKAKEEAEEEARKAREAAKEAEQARIAEIERIREEAAKEAVVEEKEPETDMAAQFEKYMEEAKDAASKEAEADKKENNEGPVGKPLPEFSDETAVITAGMTINGDVESNGNIELLGTINGDVRIQGKLSVTGKIDGSTYANEVFASGAQINGDIEAMSSVKVGQNTVIIGSVTATSAVIAGAVKGDIDVKGPVILDSSAIVMGNIKSMSVQINNGAIIDGMCSQCYAQLSPASFFNDFKKKK